MRTMYIHSNVLLSASVLLNVIQGRHTAEFLFEDWGNVFFPKNHLQASRGGGQAQGPLNTLLPNAYLQDI